MLNGAKWHEFLDGMARTDLISAWPCELWWIMYPVSKDVNEKYYACPFPLPRSRIPTFGDAGSRFSGFDRSRIFPFVAACFALARTFLVVKSRPKLEERL